MSRFGNLFRATAAAALTAAGAATVDAQTPDLAPTGATAPAAVAPTQPTVPALPDVNDLFTTGLRHRPTPGYCQPNPCCPTPGMPGTYSPGFPPITSPGTGMGMPPGTGMGPGGGTTTVDAPGTPNLFAGADAGPTAGLGGYIDNAVPVTMFRLRFDSAYGNNRPDRAEFFYAKCGCFGTPDAHGPPLPETSVDYQQLYSYLEYAIVPRLSVYANVPYRWINPDQNINTSGWSDLVFGGKYAFVYTQTRVVSLQVGVIVPTGVQQRGLGTGVTWLEPGLLYQEQLSDRWQLFGQLKDQIFLTRQSDFTGNVLTYGLGTSYAVASGCWGYVAPVGEVVGWTALSGKEADVTGAVTSARGDTIVNGKVGVRVGFGPPQLGQPYPTRSDLYIGYGRALTGEVWYKNMFRVEYRLFF